MSEEPRGSSTVSKGPRRLHQGFFSFGCMLVGWMVMVAFVFWRYSEHAGVSHQWYSMPVAITVGSVRYVGLTWLLLVLPLFLVIRPGAAFWRLFLCVPIFAGSGLLIMASISRFNYAYPWSLIWLLAAICGGATGLASAIVQRLTMGRIRAAEQVVSPNGCGGVFSP